MQKTILSTADVARLFDVTETTVKRWADEGTLKCQKTPGGHRKFEIKYVVEFAEENKFDPVGALESMREEKFSRRLQTSVLSRDYLVLAEEFVERALSTDEGNIFAYLSYLYEHKIAPWEIFDRVIQAGMHEIGERWSCGEVGVDQEHRASYRTLQALARLQGQVLRKPPTGKSSLHACVGEELHDIGLRCTSYIFDSAGWEVHYLGARTPIVSIVAAMEAVTPTVVTLSVSTSELLDTVSRELGSIAAAARKLGAKLVIGGRVAKGDLQERGLCDEILTSSRDVMDFISRVEKGKAAFESTTG